MNDMYDSATVICSSCATSFDSAELRNKRSVCPNCGSAIERQDAACWTSIARVANLAEAGFLTDELVGLGYNARVHQQEDFSAVTDRWTSLYVIQVPPEYAEQAAARIQRFRDEDERNDGGDETLPVPLSGQIMDPHFWRPVALILLASIASFAIGQRLSGQNAHRLQQPTSLVSKMNQIGRPFVTEAVAGQARYRLSFDSRQQAWSLDTDRDNDGQYDSHRRYRASGAAW